MSAKTRDEAAEVLADPLAYTDRPRLHAALSHLRRRAPVSWVDVPDYRPFWAITKYADIAAIERNHELFTNARRPFLAARGIEPFVTSGRSLVHVDDPDHRRLRAITADWFSPRSLRHIQASVDELAKTYVDKMLAAGGECDFVKEIAVDYPLAVMMALLGLPESAIPHVRGLTREMFGRDDGEAGAASGSAVHLPATMKAYQYFAGVTASRRRHPTGDLASTIANAQINGKPLDLVDVLSYFTIFATAGHDTVGSAMSGGLLALMENADQFERLRNEPRLTGTACEEMIRWVTPTKQFMRTAVRDTAVRGTPIAAGESVLLSYVSANYDEDVFDAPFKFDIGRKLNKHLGFGHGVHYCLGAALARMQMYSLFGQLLPRLKSIELDGDPTYYPAVWVGGLKQLPIRFSLR